MTAVDTPSPSHPSPRAPRPRGRRRLLILGAAATGVALAATLAAGGVANAATPQCDEGPWTVAGASVTGAPAGFDAGDAGRTYVWHDGSGWHLRTTDATPGPHHYSGTITTSPGASFVGVDKVRLDPGDFLTVDDHHVLHYAFTTFQGIDGVNFRVTACDGDRSHEALAFALQKNWQNDRPAAIDLGAQRTHPLADPFIAHRST